MSDVEEAQAGLDFAKRFEIIKGSEVKNIRLQAVDLSDASAIADALPRCLGTCFMLCDYIAYGQALYHTPLRYPVVLSN